MAGASLLVLLDDIATILDDVAAMSKVAARNTAGVLGDDLALNAQQVSGVASERELPVVWAVAKGSFRNKLILVPAALLISAFIPWAITPLLMFGGIFLCYEGFEKVHHSYVHRKDKKVAVADEQIVEKSKQDLAAFEKKKVQGAIRTDFVLSAEIIAISLGVVSQSSLMSQFLTLSVIAIIMTVGVYGLVAGIVKIDDLGLYLTQRKGEGTLVKIWHKIGFWLLAAAPYLMKGLTIIGTIAMFMVGGGILTHGIHIVSEQISHIAVLAGELAYVGVILQTITPSLLNALFGLIAGGVTLLLINAGLKLKQQLS
ncbi:DUF808 domain-containing protein [Shewanella sp. 6_MG-2023]|uniref:DUF808 domain-containing protein n=1 Tax=Shewanella sp. 6_MG-2023 TaxID=3062660 RepID=UPI0026E431E5|nr:DUF808 domain-containing protein [Shewanella sp. 6_MG-2023]MDO6619263.1 DUF808 domain-containing protein [Shewanella sp. 6_MG-2023]